MTGAVAVRQGPKPDFNLRRLMAMTDQEVSAYFEFSRFGGAPKCVRCGSIRLYSLETRGKWKCASCSHQFSVTSGGIFQATKLPIRMWLATCFLFSATSQGMSSITAARLLGVTQKTAYLNFMKLRHVLLREAQSVSLRGVVEIDGAIFGGHRRLESSIRPIFGRRISSLNANQRRCVVVAKQRLGRTRVFVGASELEAVPFLKTVVEQGSVLQIDGSRAWDGLAAAYDALRTEHLYTFGSNDQNTNSAESYFSGFRRMHRGVHHQIHGEQMALYAHELAWKRDHQDLTTTERFQKFMGLCLSGEGAPQ